MKRNENIDEIILEESLKKATENPYIKDDLHFALFSLSLYGINKVLEKYPDVKERFTKNPFYPITIDNKRKNISYSFYSLDGKQKSNISIANNTIKNDLLNSFCHELFHLIKTEKIITKDSTILKSGFHILPEDGLEENLIFEEIIHTFQVSDIMKEISPLIDCPIKIPSLHKFLSKLDSTYLTDPYGYEYSTILFFPLWEEKTFHDKAFSYNLNHDITSLKNYFNSVNNIDLWDYFLTSLGTLEREDINEEEYKLNVSTFCTIRNLYLENKRLVKKK